MKGFIIFSINDENSRIIKLPRVNRMILGLMAHYKGEIAGVLSGYVHCIHRSINSMYVCCNIFF